MNITNISAIGIVEIGLFIVTLIVFYPIRKLLDNIDKERLAKYGVNEYRQYSELNYHDTKDLNNKNRNLNLIIIMTLGFINGLLSGMNFGSMYENYNYLNMYIVIISFLIIVVTVYIMTINTDSLSSTFTIGIIGELILLAFLIFQAFNEPNSGLSNFMSTKLGAMIYYSILMIGIFAMVPIFKEYLNRHVNKELKQYGAENEKLNYELGGIILYRYHQVQLKYSTLISSVFIIVNIMTVAITTNILSTIHTNESLDMIIMITVVSIVCVLFGTSMMSNLDRSLYQKFKTADVFTFMILVFCIASILLV